MLRPPLSPAIHDTAKQFLGFHIILALGVPRYDAAAAAVYYTHQILYMRCRECDTLWRRLAKQSESYVAKEKEMKTLHTR